MTVEIDFVAWETDLINADRLNRTVKLAPDNSFLSTQSSSYGELLSGIVDAGIQAEEIAAIYKVSSKDSSYYVLLNFLDIVECSKWHH